MFEGDKFMTRGVHESIPIELQLFIWETIANMPAPKDYFQVFDLKIENGMQVIRHYSEQPEYDRTYILAAVEIPITAKIYVIDDYFEDEDKHISTMLLAEEY
ncbi:MAG: hypothetical protein J6M07_08160 [Ruminococcus sp.]|nr:hypothetical protein [Ruminococcus sp.]